MSRKKAKTYCIAENCKNTDVNSEQFFDLPRHNKDPQRRRKWLTLLGREDLLEKTNAKRRVCSAHFDTSSIMITRRLKDDAVPTMFLASNQQDESSCSNSRSISTQTTKACSTARLVLYKRDASPPSNAVRMVGAILGLHFDYVEPDLLKLEHRTPEFRKINPMATIPVLKDGDLTVSESHAIILYLVNKYGGDHKEALYPSDFAARAIVDQCMFFDAGVLFRRLLEVSQPSFMGKADGPSKKNIFDIEEGYAVIEAYLEGGPYVAGESLTVADISLGSTVAALQGIHVLDAAKFPRAKAWLDRLSTETYFKEINAPGAALLAKMLRHFWKQNKKE